MIKTIDVAGIELDNYTVRETIMNVEKNMSDSGFHTIEEVNMEMLLQAESAEVIREALAPSLLLAKRWSRQSKCVSGSWNCIQNAR